MSFGIPVRNGLALGLTPSTALSTRRIGGRPALFLNFVGTTELDSRVTFTRTNPVATFVGSNGFIQTAASNVPRFDYDPVTLQPKGLLIEEQRTNSLLYSEQFDNTAWVKTQTTVTANDVTVVAPDGTTNADKLTETTATSEHYIEQGSVSIVAGSSYTFSIYVKAAGRSQVILRYTLAASWVGGVSPQVLYDFSTLTTTIISGGSAITARSLTAVGGGWYRCSITATCATTSSPSARLHLYNGGISYAGNTALGVYLYGSQVETGAFGTSYIPTTTPAVIRSADIAAMTGTNFSSWYNQSEGTFVVGGDAAQMAGQNYALVSVDDGTSNERMQIRRSPPGTDWSAIVVDGGGVQATLNNLSSAAAANIALAYKLNDMAAVANGGTIIADGTATVPTPTQMQIGFGAGIQSANGHIRYINYYNTRLSDPTLQALTS